MSQPIDAADIPEIAYPDYLILAEPPEDQYKMMIEVDQWAAEQAEDVFCQACDGTGHIDLEVACSHCEGYGRVAGMNPETGEQDVETHSETCPICSGYGRLPARDRCPYCEGTGKIENDLKPHGLAWLALSEQARIEHCENYMGADQHSAKNARED